MTASDSKRVLPAILLSLGTLLLGPFTVTMNQPKINMGPPVFRDLGIGSIAATNYLTTVEHSAPFVANIFDAVHPAALEVEIPEPGERRIKENT